jgi:hypothetical protein
VPPVGFEPTIPVFEWAKTVHALDHAATMNSFSILYRLQILQLEKLDTGGKLV